MAPAAHTTGSPMMAIKRKRWYYSNVLEELSVNRSIDRAQKSDGVQGYNRPQRATQ